MLSRQVLASLNDILKCDYGALSELIRERVICGEGLENHPHVVCEDGRVGLLGILNGVLEPIIGHRIAAVFDDVTDVLTGFVKYPTELEEAE